MMWYFIEKLVVNMKMELFDIWNERKKQIHVEGVCPPYFSSGQIWWAQLGKNIATEIMGKGNDFLRPILIFRIVYGNACIAIPLSSVQHEGDYYFSFQDSKGFAQCALLTQIRYIDGKRLKYRQSQIKKEDLGHLQRALLCVLLGKKITLPE